MTEHAVQEQAANFDTKPQNVAEPSKLKLLLRRRSTLAFMLCVPLLILVFGLIVYPFGYSIYLSMLNKRETKFVWFANYFFLFKRDMGFRKIEIC